MDIPPLENAHTTPNSDGILLMEDKKFETSKMSLKNLATFSVFIYSKKIPSTIKICRREYFHPLPLPIYFPKAKLNLIYYHCSLLLASPNIKLTQLSNLPCPSPVIPMHHLLDCLMYHISIQ